VNQTYLNYGARKARIAKAANRAKQDRNSRALSKASYVERNIVKSKKQYAQASADLVSAYMEDEKSVGKIAKEYLPDALKGKSRSEIKAILETKKQERAVLQSKIKKLEAKRAKFLAEKNKKEGNDLGTAIIRSIRKQAGESGFVFKD